MVLSLFTISCPCGRVPHPKFLTPVVTGFVLRGAMVREPKRVRQLDSVASEYYESSGVRRRLSRV